MTCLISADLDNYARLTCYWLHEGALSIRIAGPVDEQ